MSDHKNIQNSFPVNTAGRCMITHVPQISEAATLKQVDELLRTDLFATINYIYAVNQKKQLVGVVSIKELFRREPDTKVVDIMKSDLITVRAHTPKGKLGRLALKHSLKSLPVTDKQGKLIGMVDSDMLQRIIDQEGVDDFLRISGVVPHGATEFMEIPLIQSLQHRLPWLLMGLMGGVITANLIANFESTLSENILVAAFIPLVVYLAGAIGNQLVVFMIRGLASETEFSLPQYFIKQLPIISSLGVITGLCLGILSYLMYQDFTISIVLFISIFCASLASIITGILIPTAFKKIGIDPADASGPISTVVQDFISVSIYLLVAFSLIN